MEEKCGFRRGSGGPMAVDSGDIASGIRTDYVRHSRRPNLFTLQAMTGLAVALALLSGTAQAQISVSTPALLNSNGAADAGIDAFPHVVTDGAGNWVAVWQSRANAAVEDDIFVARSTDNGATWTAPVLLNTNGAADVGGDEFPCVATDGVGNWVAVWQSTENLNGTGYIEETIFVARSTDNGASWTAPALLNTNNIPDQLRDWAPQVVSDGAGGWIAVWAAETLNGMFDPYWNIFVARSTDNGASWTAPALLNTNGTTDAGEDLFPQMTTDGAGNWVAVWESNENLNGTAGTDDDIFVARSTDNGAIWSAPTLLNANGNADTGNEMISQVTTDGVGNWIAAFASSSASGVDAFVARSTNNGASWSAATLLKTNGIADAGYDGAPRVATDGTGAWIAVWASTDDLNGSVGSDPDILVARFWLDSPSPADTPTTGEFAIALLILSISALYVRRTHIRRT